VTTSQVVLTRDVREQRMACFGLGLETASVNELALEAGEEALGHRVVVGVADGAHRRTHAHRIAAAAEG